MKIKYSVLAHSHFNQNKIELGKLFSGLDASESILNIEVNTPKIKAFTADKQFPNSLDIHHREIRLTQAENKPLKWWKVESVVKNHTNGEAVDIYVFLHRP